MFFGRTRIQNVMPAKARCAICAETSETRCRDLDFGGRFICDECAPFVINAENVLRAHCHFDVPSDALIEEHL